jgi:hypothetical protein
MKNLYISSLIFFFCTTGILFAQPTGQLTYGLVQQVVVKGASKEKIVESLGSPNMITSTTEKAETWIYDKISTTVENQSDSSNASVGGGIIVVLLDFLVLREKAKQPTERPHHKKQ